LSQVNALPSSLAAAGGRSAHILSQLKGAPLAAGIVDP
jgi:hypothetical protein